jgi:hypothetical protein
MKYGIASVVFIVGFFAFFIGWMLMTIFGLSVWISCGITILILLGLVFLATRETDAPDLKMKESVWLDDEEE